jgi:hypothetical protein
MNPRTNNFESVPMKIQSAVEMMIMNTMDHGRRIGVLVVDDERMIRGDRLQLHTTTKASTNINAIH